MPVERNDDEGYKDQNERNCKIGNQQTKIFRKGGPGKGHKTHTADHRANDAESNRPAWQAAIGDEVSSGSLLPAPNPKAHEADHGQIQQDGEVIQQMKCVHWVFFERTGYTGCLKVSAGREFGEIETTRIRSAECEPPRLCFSSARI